MQALTMTSGPGAIWAMCRPAPMRDINGPDPIIDLVYALGAEYRANATFVMNSKTAGVIRKLKDADGRFLWSDGLAAGEPARLMGYPVLIAEDMPDVATGADAIVFGDFAAGYTVAERPDLRVPARPVQRQAACPVLRDQARGRRCQRLCRDQAAEIRHLVNGGVKGPAAMCSRSGARAVVYSALSSCSPPSSNADSARLKIRMRARNFLEVIHDVNRRNCGTSGRVATG